ncbi:hypothetical protein EON81_14875 [bacterium]|nr:MAG: hypothetical protein EON81_14875 [bacterium]
MPDWAQKCQFCNTDTKAVARPVAAGPRPVNPAFAAPKWVWGAYYATSVYFIIGGFGDIFEAIRETETKFMGVAQGYTFSTYLGLIFGGLTILFGIGLLLRIEIVRGIMNFFCGLTILFGLLQIPGSLFGAVLSPLGMLWAVMNILDIVTAVFMIFLIGETDKAAPNF